MREEYAQVLEQHDPTNDDAARSTGPLSMTELRKRCWHRIELDDHTTLARTLKIIDKAVIARTLPVIKRSAVHRERTTPSDVDARRSSR